MGRLISVIMPAYNEGARIFDNISTTMGVLNDAGLTFEIIAIDDGSSDNTLSEIKRAAETFPLVKAASNKHNMGKGMALKNGFAAASGDIVVFMDADLDIHPSQISNLIDKLDSGQCDVVVTSKHHPESKLSYPLSRKIVSYVYYLIIKILFNLPVRDTQTGLKLFRHEVLDHAFHRMLVKTYAYDVELLAITVSAGYTVKEIPVVLDSRRGMKWGRITIRDVITIFLDTLAIFYRLRILKYYDRD